MGEKGEAKMEIHKSKIICVFGANNPRPGEEAYEYAAAVGRVLATLGYTVATGGYAGIMEAAAKGAKSVGGVTDGVTCRLWGSKPNEYLDHVLDTCDLYGRARQFIELGEGGYVALSGAPSALPLYDTMAILGSDMTRRRLQYAIEALGTIGFPLSEKKLKKMEKEYQEAYGKNNNG
jgi:hypothetical protein